MAVAEDSSRRAYWDGRGAIWLWTAMLAAPAAWTLDQGLSYPSVKPSCFGGSEAALLIYPIVAIAMVIAGAWIGWTCLAGVRDAAEDGGRVIDRSYFMAMVAIGFNVLIGLLIITATIPVFLLSPCE